jgi:hypothetical protein
LRVLDPNVDHAARACAGHKYSSDNSWVAYLQRLGVNGARV